MPLVECYVTLALLIHAVKNKSPKYQSDGDDDSLESNPAYNNQAEFQRYTSQHRTRGSDNGLQSTVEINDPFNEPQVTVGSVGSTSSSVYYSKPTILNGQGPEDLEDSSSTVYYSQPFSLHLPAPEHTAGTAKKVLHNKPPLPKSRDSDGIATVPNVSYRQLVSSESKSQINS